MKRLIFSALVLSAVTANAQVKEGMIGVNTDEPRATMHIEPGVSESKGLIIPRITADQMKTMTNLAHFGADHHAIITYLKEDLPAADRTGKLVDVAEPGYYFYNHTAAKWQKFGGSGEQDLRAVESSAHPGLYNHLTQDAGIGGNGTSLGTGRDNIGIGRQTFGGFANTTDLTGERNIGVGRYIYMNNGGTMSGSVNTAIGHAILTMDNGGNMQGGSNIALGSLMFNLVKANAQFTGGTNIGIGFNSFFLPNGDFTGGNNTGIGSQLFQLQNGNLAGMNNIAMGNDLYYMRSGNMAASNNIAMGGNIYAFNKTTGAVFTGSNNTGIGKDLFTLQNGNLTGSANIGIGKGLFKLQSGNLIGDNNIGIGYNSYVVQTGDMSYNAKHNIALGTDVYNSGGLFSVQNSIGIGYEVFNAAGGISGLDNIAIGKRAMRANVGDISGFNNIAIGTEAMRNSLGHIVGANNIAVGNNALRVFNGDTGKYNIAIGDWALGANDMGMGNGNIQIGNMNEAPPVTGRRNNVVAIGNRMGDIDSSVPDNVILLGAKSGTTNSPRVGVGIYQPRAKLDVAGEIRIGTEGNACTSVNEGAIRYVRTYKLFQGCDGTNWVDLN